MSLLAPLFILLLIMPPLYAGSIPEDCEVPSVHEEFIEQNLTISCLSLMESKICRGVAAEEKRECAEPTKAGVATSLEYVTGCAIGLFNSAKELLRFLADATIFVWENISDRENFKKNATGAKDFASSIKLYLYTEYDRALEKASFPKKINAARAVGADLLSFLVKSLKESVSQKYQEFSCLNESAQSQKLCQLLGDIIIPPAGFFAILKGSTQVDKSFSLFNNTSRIDKRLAQDSLKARKEALRALQDNAPGLSITFNKQKFLEELIRPGICDEKCARSQLEYLEEMGKNPLLPPRRAVDALVQEKVLSLPLKEMAPLLEKQGFKRIETCVKLKGSCIKLPDGREAPMLVFVHESGVVVRVKPEAIPGQIREKPHSSIMLVRPSENFAAELTKIKSHADGRRFGDKMLGWDQELVKVDPTNGKLIPKYPAHLQVPDAQKDPQMLKVYADVIMERAHPDLVSP